MSNLKKKIKLIIMAMVFLVILGLPLSECAAGRCKPIGAECRKGKECCPGLACLPDMGFVSKTVCTYQPSPFDPHTVLFGYYLPINKEVTK